MSISIPVRLPNREISDCQVTNTNFRRQSQPIRREYGKSDRSMLTTRLKRYCILRRKGSKAMPLLQSGPVDLQFIVNIASQHQRRVTHYIPDWHSLTLVLDWVYMYIHTFETDRNLIKQTCTVCSQVGWLEDTVDRLLGRYSRLVYCNSTDSIINKCTID